MLRVTMTTAYVYIYTYLICMIMMLQRSLSRIPGRMSPIGLVRRDDQVVT